MSANNEVSKKLNYQLQQMAFQKYPYQINNKTFYCFQNYYQEELLNGVDLQLKQAKGITNDPNKITYINYTQELILTMGSNLIAYSAQKRSYYLLTQVTGHIEIIRNYSCKLNDKNFLFWLQSDQQGLNHKQTHTTMVQIQQKSHEPQIINKKSTSIWHIKDENLKEDDEIENSQKKIEQKQQTISDQSIKKHVHFNQVKKQKPASKLKTSLHKKQNQKSNYLNKKKMKICIFDYEKRILIHQQPVQIDQNKTISDIVLYFANQQIIGYVINNEKQLRANIYYRKIKVNQNPQVLSKSMYKLIKKQKFPEKRAQKFNILQSIYEIPMLKYNGQTDQYLFKDTNTIYSLQLYRQDEQLALILSKPKITLKSLIGQKKSVRFLDQSSMNKMDLSDQSQMDSNVGIQVKENQQKKVSKAKFKLRIAQEIQLFEEDQLIADFSISQIYLAVLTTSYIRFYSIFNLNTLLFKFQLLELKEMPSAVSVQINKTYVFLTHENSTLISSYTLLQRSLKYNSTCDIEIEHCEQIVKLYMNTYNSEVTILAKQYELEGRITSVSKSKKVIQSSLATYKKSFIDISLAYINFSSTKCEPKPLSLKNQKFRNVLTCKWNSQYFIETQSQILAKDWRQAFENLKCSCLHPTGQYLIIGFNDCFKIYAVTQEGLQNTYMSDGVKECQSIAYSQLGEHFAVGSGSTICIYDSYKCKKRYTVHLPVGSLVESLQYKKNQLICILKNKRITVYHVLLDYKEIYAFNPKNYLNENKHQFQRRTGESAQNLMALTIKGLASIDVSSLFYDLQLNVIIFSSGKKIFFFNTLTNESLGNFQMEGISCMQYHKNLSTLFLGTNNGQLIAYPWPNKPSNIMAQIPRFKYHNNKIIKIKVTTDYRHLITIGADLSMYKSNVNYVLNLKRLRGPQIGDNKGLKNTVNYCNFLLNKGMCQFSHSQTIEKVQNKKQLQQEVVNTVFMLPEQRLKQKQHLVNQISTKKSKLIQNNFKEQEPLQQISLGMRNKVISLKEELRKNYEEHQAAIENGKQQFKNQVSKLMKIFFNLNSQNRITKLQYQQAILKAKHINKKQYEQLLKSNQVKFLEIQKKLKQAEKQNLDKKNNFLEIDLLSEEKNIYLEQNLRAYVKEIELLATKNGQITCLNSSTQKQIHILKYRIEQLKFVCLNSTTSIEKLQNKKQKQLQQQSVFEKLLFQNSKIDVSEMQKKYIKATKQLIQKNKQIDVKLIQYQKEKQMLVQLEKTVQKTQEQIDKVVDDMHKQKIFFKLQISKQQNFQSRIQQLSMLKNQTLKLTGKSINYFRKFINKLKEIQLKNNNFYTFDKQNAIYNQNQSFDLLRKIKQLITPQQFCTQSDQIKQPQKITKQTFFKTDSKQLDEGTLKTQMRSTLRKNKNLNANNTLSQIITKITKRTGSSGSSTTFKKNQNIIEQKQEFQQKAKPEKSQQNQSLNFRLNLKAKKMNKAGSSSSSRKYLMSLSQRHSLMSKTISNFKELGVSKQPKSHYYQVRTQQNQAKNKSQKQLHDHISSYDLQKLTDNKKQLIFKQLTTEQKLMNKIKTQRKMYVHSKNKLFSQNQDLISTYNSLNYDSKYFKNIIKVYQQSLDQQNETYVLKDSKNMAALSKKFINLPTQNSEMKLQRSPRTIQTFNNYKQPEVKIKKATPFEKYIINKSNKNNNLAISHNQKLQSTIRQRESQRNMLKKLSTKVTSNRINTLPCVELKL